MVAEYVPATAAPGTATWIAGFQLAELLPATFVVVTTACAAVDI
jgi:hypothetical protein